MNTSLSNLNTHGYIFWQTCEDYVNCKNASQKVVDLALPNGDKKTLSVMQEPSPIEEYAYWKTACKILSYVIFILPIVALIYCAYKRNQFQIEYVPKSSLQVEKKEDDRLIDSVNKTVPPKVTSSMEPKNPDHFFLDTKTTPKPSFNNSNKKFVYDFLMKGDIPDDQIHIHYCSLNKEIAGEQPVFRDKKLVVEVRKGNFRFDNSTDKIDHWTADFADNHLIGFCKGGLLAQEELICAEHPGLVHLYSAIQEHNSYKYLQEFGKEEGHRIALIEGAKRRGELDMYGNGFASTKQKEIEKHLTHKEPTESLIFAMAAPSPNFDSTGKPYQKNDIEIFLYRSYNAFSESKVKSEKRLKETHIHTGNWGCGAFGGSPLLAAIAQLAAAESAGIDRLVYYPRSNTIEFKKAQEILEKIRINQPKVLLKGLVDHLVLNATKYNILYGASNGT